MDEYKEILQAIVIVTIIIAVLTAMFFAVTILVPMLFAGILIYSVYLARKNM